MRVRSLSMAVGVIALPVILAGCNVVNERSNELTRASATKVVTQVLFTQFSAVNSRNVEPLTQCVVDNADLAELRELAQDAVAGTDARTVGIVTQILGRPGTRACIGNSGVAPSLIS